MYPNISVKNLYLEVNKKILFNNINITFSSNNIYALIGNNGCGKTTFFKSILGLNSQCNNHIFFNDKNLNNNINNIISKNFSFLGQNEQHNYYCSAEYRIAHGLIPVFGTDYWLIDQQKDLIKQITKNLSIEHLLHRFMHQLSGGEQRLINIAKSLVNPFVQVIILDEPSVFLDFKQKKILIDYLKSICSDKKIIIFSSHDQDFINQCATTILYLEDRQILQKQS